MVTKNVAYDETDYVFYLDGYDVTNLRMFIRKIMYST